MNLKSNVAASLTDGKSEIERALKGFKADLTDLDKSLVNEVRENGFAVIPDFLSKEFCVQAKNEIDRLINDPEVNVWKDDVDSDFRLYGADRKSIIISEFYNNTRINNILQTYEQHPYMAGFTLAAKLVAVDNNKGSGGGWHRDSASTKQTKAIAYLTDVSEENGPFQYLKYSHKRMKMVDVLMKHKIDLNTTRFTDEMIEDIVKSSKDEVVTFTAKAGTVLLVNTRGIHRGMPIQKGTRYALTNYNWLKEEIPQHIKDIMV